MLQHRTIFLCFAFFSSTFYSFQFAFIILLFHSSVHRKFLHFSVFEGFLVSHSHKNSRSNVRCCYYTYYCCECVQENKKEAELCAEILYTRNKKKLLGKRIHIRRVERRMWFFNLHIRLGECASFLYMK